MAEVDRGARFASSEVNLCADGGLASCSSADTRISTGDPMTGGGVFWRTADIGVHAAGIVRVT